MHRADVAVGPGAVISSAGCDGWTRHGTRAHKPFLVTEPMTDEVESPTSPQWAGVKRDRGQAVFICDKPEADLERFLVLS